MTVSLVTNFRRLLVVCLWTMITAAIRDFSRTEAVISSSNPSAHNTMAAGESMGVSGFKLDLDELHKRGLSPDDVIRHIRLLIEGRISVDGTCLDGTSSGSRNHHHVQQTSHHPVQSPRSSGLSNAGISQLPQSSRPRAQSTVDLNGGDMYRKFIRNKTVTCNDGSKAGYYIRKSPTGSSRWIVFLEGGWLCFDRKSCEGRWLNTPHLMSSYNWPYTRRGSGILSSDPTENPFIHDGNAVLIPYCSSDTWSGTYKTKNKGEFSFMGAVIVQEVFKDLAQLHNLGSATTIFMSGSSAGGTGVLVNLDRVARLLAQLAPLAMLRGIVDSGWFLDNEPLNRVDCHDVYQCSPAESVQRGITLWKGLVPDSCRSAYPASEHWKCYFGYRVYNTLQTVVFVVQYLFDEAQVTADNVGPPIHREELRYIYDLGQDMKQTLSNVSAVFAPACLSHMLLTRSEWGRVTVDGSSLSDALHCWESGGRNEKNHYYDQNNLNYHRHRTTAGANGLLIQGQRYFDPATRFLTGEGSRRRLQGAELNKLNGVETSVKNRTRSRHNAKNSLRHKKSKGTRLHSNESTTAVDESIGFTNNTSTRPRPTESDSTGEQQLGDSAAAVRHRRGRRQRRRRMSAVTSSTPVGTGNGSNGFNSMAALDIHDIHHTQQHAADRCQHRRIDRCSSPQCNSRCPKVRDPFTGDEVDLIELLTTRFGLDVASLARSLGIDRQTLQRIGQNHSEMLRLLVETAAR